jgi:nucleotide-binding universal stress UspA family protein
MTNKAGHELVPIRRILVALDNSRHSLAALDAAVMLAAQLKADLLGLFVEDINLLQLAGLPFAQEIHYPSATVRRLDRQKLEQELTAGAARARRKLAVAADQAHVAWSFRIVRGQVATEVLTAASEADLLSLGIAGQPSFLLQQGEKIGQPVMVTYDGTTAAKRALAIAVRLVQTAEQATSLSVVVLIFKDDMSDPAQYLEQEAILWLQEQGIQANYRRLSKVDPFSLAQVVRTEKGGLLILSGESPFSQPEILQVLLDKIDCPVLLIK